jgi:hypothetical protein
MAKKNKSCKTATCRAARLKKQKKQLSQLPKKQLKQLAHAGKVPILDEHSKKKIAEMFLDGPVGKQLTDIGAVMTPLSLGFPRDYARNLKRAMSYNFHEGQQISDSNAMCTLVIEQVHLDQNVATINNPVRQSVVRVRVPCKVLMNYCKHVGKK